MEIFGIVDGEERWFGMTNFSEYLELDEEWVELLNEARQLGFTADEVRRFLEEARTLNT